MTTAKSQDVPVQERLQALGVALLSEWDTLVFLYRHPASLGTAAQIARLIGHDQAAVGTALNSLEALGMMRRARVYQGRRLYQFSEPPEPGSRSCLLELMGLAQNREGRMLLIKNLKGPPAVNRDA